MGRDGNYYVVRKSNDGVEFMYRGNPIYMTNPLPIESAKIDGLNMLAGMKIKNNNKQKT
jgi:hypothetical protein